MLTQAAQTQKKSPETSLLSNLMSNLPKRTSTPRKDDQTEANSEAKTKSKRWDTIITHPTFGFCLVLSCPITHNRRNCVSSIQQINAKIRFWLKLHTVSFNGAYWWLEKLHYWLDSSFWLHVSSVIFRVRRGASRYWFLWVHQSHQKKLFHYLFSVHISWILYFYWLCRGSLLAKHCNVTENWKETKGNLSLCSCRLMTQRHHHRIRHRHPWICRGRNRLHNHLV